MVVLLVLPLAHMRGKTMTLNMQSTWCCRFVGGLSGLHTYFTSRNKSTYEHFRSRAGSHENPYDVNCISNWQQVPFLAHLVRLTTAGGICPTFVVAAWHWEGEQNRALSQQVIEISRYAKVQPANAGVLHSNPSKVPGDSPVHAQGEHLHPMCLVTVAYLTVHRTLVQRHRTPSSLEAARSWLAMLL